MITRHVARRCCQTCWCRLLQHGNTRVSVIHVVLRANCLTEQRNAKAHWVSQPTQCCWVEMSPEAPEKRRLIYLSQTRRNRHITNTRCSFTSFSLAGKFWRECLFSSPNKLLLLSNPAPPPQPASDPLRLHCPSHDVKLHVRTALLQADFSQVYGHYANALGLKRWLKLITTGLEADR